MTDKIEKLATALYEASGEFDWIDAADQAKEDMRRRAAELLREMGLDDRPANLPAVTVANEGISDRALIREIAMDIGKSTVEHIELGYPAALEAVAKTARISIRNHVHNEIMSALDTTDVDAIKARIAERKLDRRRRLALYRRIRAEDRQARESAVDPTSDAAETIGGEA